MHYFAKLILGGTYRIKSKAFEKNIELPVSKEDYDYLSTVHEKRRVSEGNAFKIVQVPRFAMRTEELSKEEKALDDTKEVPDKLGVKKPALK